MNRRIRSIAALAGIAAAAALSGCSSHDEVSADPSPNMDTLYQRPDDIDNSLTVMADENFRMFWQDLGRAFYVNRPSRLTREPVPVP